MTSCFCDQFCQVKSQLSTESGTLSSQSDVLSCNLFVSAQALGSAGIVKQVVKGRHVARVEVTGGTWSFNMDLLRFVTKGGQSKGKLECWPTGLKPFQESTRQIRTCVHKDKP